MATFGLALWIAIAGTAAQPEGTKPALVENAAKKDAAPDTTKAAVKKESTSEADHIIRLQRQLDTDSKNLEKTNKELKDPNNEYHKADASLNKLETALNQKRAEIQKLKTTDPKANTAKLESEIAALEKQRGLARDRFEVAIKERNILRDRSALLAVKIAKSQQAIALLQGTAPEPAAPSPTTTPASKPNQPKTAVPAPGTQQGGPLPSVELLKAQKAAAVKEAEAKTAKDKLQSIDDHVLFLNKNIELDKRMIAMLQEKAANAADIHANFKKELDKQRAAKASEMELAGLTAKLTKAEKLVTGTAKDLLDTREHLKRMEGDLKKLQTDKQVAQRHVERADQEVEKAEQHLKYVQSPFAWHNIIVWLWRHVPTVAIIVLAMALLEWLVHVASRRVVQWMTRYHFRGSQQDRENRADTLSGVFRNAFSFVILAGGMLMILQAIGIAILPLLGGAAAGGLAVAFGAQNLIKDYLSGFMLLLEDQYGLNDVVKIAGIAGQVESITLRVTVLRDNEGTVHFVPHSTIATVSNMTHRWARAFFEIRVAYKEDIDRVMLELISLCKEMRHDPAFSPYILEDPEMLGVDQLTEDGVNIQFLLRTSPLKQWPVKRELLRRIKARFDELGIELPHHEFAYEARHPSADGQPSAH